MNWEEHKQQTYMKTLTFNYKTRFSSPVRYTGIKQTGYKTIKSKKMALPVWESHCNL